MHQPQYFLSSRIHLPYVIDAHTLHLLSDIASLHCKLQLHVTHCEGCNPPTAEDTPSMDKSQSSISGTSSLSHDQLLQQVAELSVICAHQQLEIQSQAAALHHSAGKLHLSATVIEKLHALVRQYGNHDCTFVELLELSYSPKEVLEIMIGIADSSSLLSSCPHSADATAMSHPPSACTSSTNTTSLQSCHDASTDTPSCQGMVQTIPEQTISADVHLQPGEQQSAPFLDQTASSFPTAAPTPDLDSCVDASPELEMGAPSQAALAGAVAAHLPRSGGVSQNIASRIVPLPGSPVEQGPPPPHTVTAHTVAAVTVAAVTALSASTGLPTMSLAEQGVTSSALALPCAVMEQVGTLKLFWSENNPCSDIMIGKHNIF